MIASGCVLQPRIRRWHSTDRGHGKETRKPPPDISEEEREGT